MDRRRLAKRGLLGFSVVIVTFMLFFAGAISQWTLYTGDFADDDLFGITDVSDTTQSANGTSKRTRWDNIVLRLSSLFQATDSTLDAISNNSGTVSNNGVDYTVKDLTAEGDVDLTSANSFAMGSPAMNGVLSTDNTKSGFLISGKNAGETISQWDVVYFDAASTEWLQADADVSGEWPARGIAIAAGTDGNELTVLVQGTIRNDAWNWTVGGTIYLSDTASGLTQTAPSTSGDCVQVLGWAITADIIYFNASGHWVEAP